jgi:hypothetical protein
MFTKEFIKDKLNTNQAWLERGIVAIWKYQTATEQRQDRTVEDNGVGFNGIDAKFLSSLAKWIQNSKFAEGERLSPKQAFVARKKMAKYAGQLARIATDKQ